MSKKMFMTINAVMTFAAAAVLALFFGRRMWTFLGAAIRVLAADGSNPVWLDVVSVLLVFVLPVVLRLVDEGRSWEAKRKVGDLLARCLLGAPLFGLVVSFLGMLAFALLYAFVNNWQTVLLVVGMLIAIIFVGATYDATPPARFDVRETGSDGRTTTTRVEIRKK